MGKQVKRPLVFECVGMPGVIQSLAEAAPPGTRIVVAGVCMETDRIEPLVYITKEIELRFVLGYSRDEFAKSLANLAEGRTRYNEIITGVVGLEDTPDAFVTPADRQEPDQDPGRARAVGRHVLLLRRLAFSPNLQCHPGNSRSELSGIYLTRCATRKSSASTS